MVYNSKKGKGIKIQLFKNKIDIILSQISQCLGIRPYSAAKLHNITQHWLIDS